MAKDGNRELFGRGKIERCNPSPREGLTTTQVNTRITNGWQNKPVEAPSKTVKEIILSNVFTYFNVIFFIVAIALILVGSFKDLTFMVIIIVNLLIGIVQEIKSKKTLDSLSLMNQPHALVIRDGAEKQISTEKLVIDDIVVLSSGNQISADAVVLEGELQVNESMITGESDDIIKKPGDKLLSGSYVVSGNCYARLYAVGEDSFVSKLTLDAKKSKKKASKGMMLSMKRLIQFIGIIIIPLAVGLFLRQMITMDTDIKSNVVSVAASITGMIPDGLYLLISVTLAVSVIRLAKKDTLVHDLGCIEMLARVDTLCVDKTGTITDNSMCVDGIVPIANGVDVKYLLREYIGNIKDDNITMKALRGFVGDSSPNRRAVGVLPFSSKYKMSGVEFSPSEIYLLGAPEFVLKDLYHNYAKNIEPYVNNGKRVLVFAQSASMSPENTGRIIPLALIVLSNPIRVDAPETFEYFNKQGVDIKVISGDNPMTVAAAAKNAKISNSDKFIDLNGLSNEEVENAANEYNIFGRVTPDQKRILVKSLKKAGHTVAMTGDGVNDILAMKEADCSIAMASGSDVACQVSQIVLMKSQFSSLPSVVAEGRQVINNIQRSASLFLVKNIFTLMLTLASIIAVFNYPFSAKQIMLVSTVTIGIPSFILALEKNEDRVKGKFLLNAILPALPGALTNFIVVIGVILFKHAYGISDEISSTIMAVLLALVGFSVIVEMCKPFNWKRITLIFSMIILFTLALIIMPGMFGIYALDFGGWLVLAVFTLLIPSVIYTMTKGLNSLYTTINKLNKGSKKEK